MPEPAAIVATLMGQLNVAIMDGPHTAGETNKIISSLLKTLPIMGQQPLPKWDEAVIAPMGGDIVSVAQAALKHLHFHVTHPTRDIDHICQITRSVNLVAHLSNHKPILNALIAQRSLRTIIHVLDTLAPLPSHTWSLEYVTLCISSGCNCISQHFMANNSLGCIIEAFASGILPILLRCADLLISESEQYTTLLCDYMHRFIIYPSVLSVTEKSLDGFIMPKLPITPSVTSKMVQMSYTQFIVSMVKLMAVKECGSGHGWEVCSNTKVCLFCCVCFIKHRVSPHRDLQCGMSIFKDCHCAGLILVDNQ